MSSYIELETRYRRLAAIGEATGMLHWDAAVMMPTGGADARAEQIAALSAGKFVVGNLQALGRDHSEVDHFGGFVTGRVDNHETTAAKPAHPRFGDR